MLFLLRDLSPENPNAAGNCFLPSERGKLQKKPNKPNQNIASQVDQLWNKLPEVNGWTWSPLGHTVQPSCLAQLLTISAAAYSPSPPQTAAWPQARHPIAH